jgi:hypothetical protein
LWLLTLQGVLEKLSHVLLSLEVCQEVLKIIYCLYRVLCHLIWLDTFLLWQFVNILSLTILFFARA